jgi:hypothetical protein
MKWIHTMALPVPGRALRVPMWGEGIYHDNKHRRNVCQPKHHKVIPSSRSWATRRMGVPCTKNMRQLTRIKPCLPRTVTWEVVGHRGRPQRYAL